MHLLGFVILSHGTLCTTSIYKAVVESQLLQINDQLVLHITATSSFYALIFTL